METVDQKTKNAVLKSQAVRQAMVEVLAENKEEVIKRARAKLRAMGVELEDSEVNDAPVS